MFLFDPSDAWPRLAEPATRGSPVRAAHVHVSRAHLVPAGSGGRVEPPSGSASASGGAQRAPARLAGAPRSASEPPARGLGRRGPPGAESAFTTAVLPLGVDPTGFQNQTFGGVIPRVGCPQWERCMLGPSWLSGGPGRGFGDTVSLPPRPVSSLWGAFS